MSAESAIYAGRQAAEATFLDTGTALHPTGDYVLVGGVDVEATVTLFASPCKIQTRQVQARESDVGGRTAVEVRTELHVPADTAPLAVGDLWEIVTAHPLSLSVVGQRLRITAPVAGTFKTARRYEVEEVVA